MTTRDPFLIEGPAVISFSGGRSSAYMLWRILQAHQWVLPDDVKVVFANTGKEMGETLDFVRDCSVHWNVPVTWVEFYRDTDGSFQPRDEELRKSFKIVTHDTASRDGEPFACFLRNADVGYLPNPIARQCSVQLKIRTIERYMMSCGWNEWTTAIGMRADEPYRVAKIKSDPSGGRKGQNRIAPLAEAGVTVLEIGEFWKAQPFNLMLPNMNGKTMHGNCDLCFLKGADQVVSLIRESPERAKWWIKQEADSEARRGNDGMRSRFRKDRPSYASMYRMATQHGELFPFDDEPLQDCMCTD